MVAARDGRRGWRALAGLALLAGLSACAALPEMQRAEHALAQGRRDDAEQEYRALARFGLPAGQLALGDLLSRPPTTPARRTEAVQWYERAARRDSRALGRLAGLYARDAGYPAVAADGLLDRMAAAYARGELALAGDIADLLLARGAGRNAGEIGAWAERASAIGDKRGDYLLGVLCNRPLRPVPDVACAKAHYQQAEEAIPEAAGSLLALQQQQPDPESAGTLARRLAGFHVGAARYAVYRAYLRKVNGVPQVTVAEALLSGLFDDTTSSTSDEATQANAIADPELDQDAAVYNPTDAAVELARAYAGNVGEEAREKLFALLPYLRRARPLEAALIEADVDVAGNLVPTDAEAARQLLLPWVERSPAAAYALANLYRTGLLDEPDFGRAEQLFRQAAEGGLGKSWYVLTRLYVGTPGLKPDPARAMAYAEKARQAGYSHVDGLLELIEVPPGASR